MAYYGVSELPYSIDMQKSPPNFYKSTFQPKEELAYEYVCGLLRDDPSLPEKFMTHTWGFDKIADAFEQVKSGEVIKGLVVM